MLPAAQHPPSHACVDAACAGAYAWFVSCSLEGIIGNDDVIHSAMLVLTLKVTNGINPLGPRWKSDAGPGPAVLVLDMVRRGAALPPCPASC
jgi:hypothetical protein